jgi:hypothetical protein
LTKKHVAQGESKETPILVDTTVAECGQVQRTGNERVGKDRHAIIHISRRVFPQYKVHGREDAVESLLRALSRRKHYCSGIFSAARLSSNAPSALV